MRARACRFRSLLLVSALVIGAGAPAALAQELQLDPKALDASVAPAAPKTKGKKGRPLGTQTSGPTADGKNAGGHSPDRQFGELEGWSPGKAPPKPQDRAAPASAPGKAPIAVSPSGNMQVGVPF